MYVIMCIFCGKIYNPRCCSNEFYVMQNDISTVVYWLCVSVSVNGCVRLAKYLWQKDRIVAANMELFLFNVLHFRFACTIHKEGNATCNAQLLLCLLWQELQVSDM